MNLITLQIINLIIITVVAMAIIGTVLPMQNIKRVITWPFYFCLIIMAGIVIIYHEEKEYNRKKRNK